MLGWLFGVGGPRTYGRTSDSMTTAVAGTYAIVRMLMLMLNDIYHRTVGTATTLQDAAISNVDEAASAGALKWNTACCYLPHPEKLHYGGEDAHFISGVGGGACGVADGVGGWQESGVNPAEYSRNLMKISCQYLEGTGPFGSEPRTLGEHLVDPRVSKPFSP